MSDQTWKLSETKQSFLSFFTCDARACSMQLFGQKLVGVLTLSHTHTTYVNFLLRNNCDGKFSAYVTIQY